MDTDVLLPAPAQFLREDAIRGGMDLLLFAHKSHLRRADEELERFNLGRAHHRALYFIARRPHMSVRQLLDQLGITKQSLGRVLRDLESRKLVLKLAGERDRRERLLVLSEEGEALERRLFDDLHDNMYRAYAEAGENAVRGYWIMMQRLMASDARDQFRRFHSLND